MSDQTSEEAQADDPQVYGVCGGGDRGLVGSLVSPSGWECFDCVAHSTAKPPANL